MVTILEWLVLVSALLLLWLLPKYLVSRVTNAARGAIDEKVGKALELFRSELELSRARYSQDYQLFSTKRNDVYAELYGLLERAAGQAAPLFQMIRIGYLYGQADPRDLRRHVEEREGLLASERDGVIKELEAGRFDEAVRKLEALEHPWLSRLAEQAWTEAKNYWILHGLFLSPEVDQQMDAVNQLFAQMSTELRFPERGGIDHVKRAALLASVHGALAALKETMRSEMQAGFASSRSSVATTK